MSDTIERVSVDARFVDAVHRDLHELATDLGRLLVAARGGTHPHRRQQAAAYLINLLDANGPTTATEAIAAGLLAAVDKVER